MSTHVISHEHSASGSSSLLLFSGVVVHMMQKNLKVYEAEAENPPKMLSSFFTRQTW
jgi:hypothetical protein